MCFVWSGALARNVLALRREQFPRELFSEASATTVMGRVLEDESFINKGLPGFMSLMFLLHHTLFFLKRNNYPIKTNQLVEIC